MSSAKPSQEADAAAPAVSARTALTAPTVENIAARITEKLFADRAGHGGGECSYLQVTRGKLRDIIEAAIQLYVETNPTLGAAPDMLAVLEAARIVLKNRDQDEREAKLLDAIKAAIARATGAP